MFGRVLLIVVALIAGCQKRAPGPGDQTDQTDATDATDGSGVETPPTPSCDTCTLGAARCGSDASTIETCAADAQGCLVFTASTTCGTRQSCVDGACVCNDACTPGDLSCTTNDTFLTCATDADGCHYPSPGTCAAPKLCDADLALATIDPPCSTSAAVTCPTPVCVIGVESCVGDTAEVCALVQGCPAWTEKATCGAYEKCDDTTTPGWAECVCNAALAGPCTSALVGEVYCPVDGARPFQECLVDTGSGCPYLAPARDCPSALQTCVTAGGDNVPGVCTCPPAPACATCAGNTATTCRRDAGGCFVAKTVVCPADTGPGSSCECRDNTGAVVACATVGAHAGCTCPASSANELFVDAAHGDNRFATGAAAPAHCAYRSLTAALADATSGDTIRLRAGVYSPTATNETFPAALPDGVTISTDVVPATRDSHVVMRDNSIFTHASAGSARIENLTLVERQNGVLVDCTGGDVTLDNVALVGGNTGLSVFGTCHATLTNSFASSNNVGLSGAGDGSLSVEHHLSLRDRTPIHATAGGVALTDVEVASPLARVLARQITTTPLLLTATRLHVHHGGQSGLSIESAATDTGTTVALSEVRFEHNFDTGLSVQDVYSGLTISGLVSRNNRGGGLLVDTAGSLSVAGAWIEGNGTPVAVRHGIDLRAGTLFFTDGYTVNIFANSGDGIHAGMDGQIGGNDLSLVRNGGDGVAIESGGGEHFGCTGCIVAFNGRHGYFVTAAPPALASPFFGLDLNGGLVRGNGTSGEGHGVYLRGSGTPTAARVSGVTIRDHQAGAGLVAFHYSATAPVSAEITGNDIFANGALAANLPGSIADVGGVVLYTDGGPADRTLVFRNNRVHHNNGPGVLVVDDPGATGGTIDLSAAACDGTGDAAPNRLYCYGAGNVGLAVLAGGSATIDYAAWNEDPPASSVDYTGSVTLSQSCAETFVCQ